ncbi:MAG: hypothetical protein R2932_21005 [Caldilineaceae bacterium]
MLRRRDVFTQLATQQQAIAKNIFLRLTELGEAEDTRRRCPTGELKCPSQRKAATVRRALADRLVTTDKDRGEVATKALIQVGRRFSGWLDSGSEEHRLRTACWRMPSAGRNFGARSRNTLYSRRRLEQVAEWEIRALLPYQRWNKHFWAKASEAGAT